MVRALLLSGLLACSSACSDRDRAEAEPEVSPSVELPPTPAVFGADGLLSGPGAPDRLACEGDGDCVITSIPSSRPPAPPPYLAGCCPTSGFDPASRAFHRWMTEFRVDHCPVDRSACPDLPAPAMPADCVHEARCIEGRCANGCGAPER
jgi:hypothetical protein